MCTQHLFDEESEFIITGSYSEENCGTGNSLCMGGRGWRKIWVSFSRIYKNYQIKFLNFDHYSMAPPFSRFLLRILGRGRGLRGLKTPRGNSSRVKCWNGSPFNTITEGEIFLSLLHVHTACCLSWVAEVSVSEFAYSYALYGVNHIFMEKVNGYSSIE